MGGRPLKADLAHFEAVGTAGRQISFETHEECLLGGVEGRAEAQADRRTARRHESDGTCKMASASPPPSPSVPPST